MSTTFPQLLATEIAAVQRFVTLLSEEQLVLRNGQVDALADIIEAKGKLVDELTALGQQRHECLVQLGVAENGEAVERWLQQQQNPRLLQGWKTLQRLAQEAKSLNEMNGRCIALLARNNKQLLDAITGQQARGTFYGPDGQTASGSGVRISDSV